MVDLTVGSGKDKRTLTVHRKVITSSSNFFKTRLEAQDGRSIRTLALEDADVSLVNAYINWLYSGTIDPLSICRANVRPSVMNFNDLVILCLLGHRFADYDFVNAVTDVILSKLQESSSEDTFDALTVENWYEYSAPPELKEMLVKAFAADSTRTHLHKLDRLAESSSVPFYKDLAFSLMSVRSETRQRLCDMKSTDFHVHPPKTLEYSEPAEKRQRKD